MITLLHQNKNTLDDDGRTRDKLRVAKNHKHKNKTNKSNDGRSHNDGCAFPRASGSRWGGGDSTSNAVSELAAAFSALA